MPAEPPITWKAPPEAAVERSRHRTGKYTYIAEACRERPGEWAQLPTVFSPESARVTVQRIRKGLMAGFEEGLFEAIFSGGEVYVRFR